MNELLIYLGPLNLFFTKSQDKLTRVETGIKEKLVSHVIVFLAINYYVIGVVISRLIDYTLFPQFSIHFALFLLFSLIIICLLSFVRLFSFLYWRRLTRIWILNSKEIIKWGLNIEKTLDHTNSTT